MNINELLVKEIIKHSKNYQQKKVFEYSINKNKNCDFQMKNNY